MLLLPFREAAGWVRGRMETKAGRSHCRFRWKGSAFSGVPTAKSGGVFPALTEKKAAAGQKNLRKRRISAQRQFGWYHGPVRPI